MTIENSGGNRTRVKNDTRKADSSKRNGNKKKSKSKTGGGNSNSKFLELVALTKKFDPTTVNGIPTSKVVSKYTEESSKTIGGTDKEVNGSEGESSPFRKELPEEALQIRKLRVKDKPLNRYLLKLVKSNPREATYLSFVITPSDPDFPFELKHLKLSLIVPADYPSQKTSPSIVVLNSDIPKGHAINIENGFRKIVKGNKAELEECGLTLSKDHGLISYINSLDINLEAFLKEQKRDTVKFIKTLKRDGELRTSPSPEPNVKKEEQPKALVGSRVNQQNQGTFTPQCEHLISEVIDKGVNLKLFNKSNSKRVYRVEVPIFSSIASNPLAWSKHKKLELSISIPSNYPESNFKLTFVPNFSRNAILKYRTDDNYEELSRKESNFSNNFSSYAFDSVSILSRLNYVVNNIVPFCSDRVDFENWIVYSSVLRTACA